MRLYLLGDRVGLGRNYDHIGMGLQDLSHPERNNISFIISSLLWRSCFFL